jgi:MerR family transcriptional regulator, redox-sensitive transcriptional activator SoxR
METTATLSIGEVASQVGVRASSIRYYESVGVLPEPQRESGRRRYGPEAVDLLRAISVAQQAGFSLEEIRELLEGSEQGEASEQLRTLAQRKLPEIEELIARAQSMKAWLEAASGCDCPTLDVCALFDRDATASEQVATPSPANRVQHAAQDQDRGG